MAANSSSDSVRKPCPHEYKLDEEIGIICQICNFVRTEIKYVTPPFVQSPVWIRSKEECKKNERKEYSDLDSELFSHAISSKCSSVSGGCDSVWSLVPPLKMELHVHQKKAFEFLWRNISGSLNPRDMDSVSGNTGGCVISHSPGTGKTLSVILFLVSYLRLFPGQRPLILAPTTTLHAWRKEILKWEVSVPVHQILSRRDYRKEKASKKSDESAINLRLDESVTHLMDSLEKFCEWHKRPSILLMSYTSFWYMTRGNLSCKYRRYMGRLLRNSPGIVILDEGHNPRSTISKARAALMKVNTELRILLSGTLFQNNLGEYFNTLCLARPRFVSEVVRELDPRVTYRGEGKQRRRVSMGNQENFARKLFTEKIGRKINSSIEEERKWGLDVLRKITNGFIDVHEDPKSDKLPGLHSYTLLMNSTDVQQKVLPKLHRSMNLKSCPLELELLITVGSIHPWLVTKVACVRKYFSEDELKELNKYESDVKTGSKLKFVVDLVSRCITEGEKVLVFFHNIPPMDLFVKIFEIVFGWQRGEETLVLHGEQDLFERGRVMDKFEENGGNSRVLLASIRACSEGISLTAASRVVLLDTEWNPSRTKQAIARAFRPGQKRVVYVYKLLMQGTFEEEKHGRSVWKERMSSLIFVDGCIEGSAHKNVDDIDDDILREIVKEDQTNAFHKIMKNEVSIGSEKSCILPK